MAGLVAMLCYRANAPATVGSSYIYNFSPKYNAGFLLVTFSADGNVTVGSTDERNYWVWSKAHGTVKITGLPPGYLIDEGSITASFDGSVIAGVLGTPWPNNQGSVPKLFRWTAATGITILPALPASDIVQNILMSDDGKSISFLCTSADGNPCKGLPFPQGGEHQELKIWTAGQGYQSVGPDFGNNHNFIEQSPDLKRFLVGNSYNYWKYVNGHRAGLYIHVDPFALMDASGKITSFQTPLRDFYPQNIFTNSELSVVADKTLMHGPGWNTLVYDSSGALVATKLPLFCSHFAVSAIDGTGAIFGEADCLGRMAPTGLRISGGRAETISHWLKSAGLHYDFPENTVVWKVSDNGKTIQGYIRQNS